MGRGRIPADEGGRLPLFALLGFLSSSVFEGDSAIEDEFSGRAVFIEREVGQALELVTLIGRCILKAGFTLRRDDFEGVRVQMFLEVTLGIGLRNGEKPVVKADFGINSMRGAGTL